MCDCFAFLAVLVFNRKKNHSHPESKVHFPYFEVWETKNEKKTIISRKPNFGALTSDNHNYMYSTSSFSGRTSSWKLLHNLKL